MSKRKRSRRQEKERRQEAARRVRRGRGLEDDGIDLKFNVDFSAVDPDLLADVRGAFEPGGVISPAAMTELAIDSHDLFDEPEFQEVVSNPLLAAYGFLNLARERGLTLSSEDTDKLAPVIFSLTPFLLQEDPDLRANLISVLQGVRRKLKQQSYPLGAGRAAMAQLLLEHGDPSSWRIIGVVQRAVTHSVFAGLRMSSLQENMGEEE